MISNKSLQLFNPSSEAYLIPLDKKVLLIILLPVYIFGFCCDKCKTKFDAKPASFLSKIKGFKSSEEFTQAKAEESDAREKSGSRVDAIQVKMSKASGQLKQLGPEINMGWAQPVESQKK